MNKDSADNKDTSDTADARTKAGARKIPKTSFVVCTVAGIALLALAVICRIRLDASKKSFIPIDALVTKVEDNVYVSYTYNTDTYSNVEISMINKPSVGDTIRIYISKEDYAAAVSDDVSGSLIKGFFFTGAIFFTAGAAALILRRILGGKTNSILEGGKFIYAEVDEVIYETGTTDKNGAHPYTIRCHYDDFSGKRRQNYVLKDIYTNPNAYLAANKKKVKLYIKGKNYKKYYFDQSILKL